MLGLCWPYGFSGSLSYCWSPSCWYFSPIGSMMAWICSGRLMVASFLSVVMPSLSSAVTPTPCFIEPMIVGVTQLMNALLAPSRPGIISLTSSVRPSWYRSITSCLPPRFLVSPNRCANLIIGEPCGLFGPYFHICDGSPANAMTISSFVHLGAGPPGAYPVGGAIFDSLGYQFFGLQVGFAVSGPTV